MQFIEAPSPNDRIIGVHPCYLVEAQIVKISVLANPKNLAERKYANYIMGWQVVDGI
jgi:hypothetical protein